MSEIVKKITAFVAAKLRSLRDIHDTPHAIAGGVGLGILISFTPLFFFRVLLAICLAWALRCSKVAAAIAVNLHELIFFLWPLVYREEYRIGFWILSDPPHHFPPKMVKGINLEHFNWIALREHFDNWAKVGGPWMFGSLVIGIPVSVLAFFITLKIVETHQKAHPRPR